jgi:hypothetical protein
MIRDPAPQRRLRAWKAYEPLSSCAGFVQIHSGPADCAKSATRASFRVPVERGHERKEPTFDIVPTLHE